MRLLNCITNRLSRICSNVSQIPSEPPEISFPIKHPSTPFPEAPPKLTNAPACTASELLYRQIQLGIALEYTQGSSMALNKPPPLQTQTQTLIEDRESFWVIDSFDSFGGF